MRDRRGAMMALVAALLPVLIIFVALFINIAFMELTRTELRIATDAAARAGGRQLALTGNLSEAKAKARDAASRNTIAGQPLELADSDFTFGDSERPSQASRYMFTVDNANPNALMVSGRRTDASPGGSVPLFFPIGLANFQPIQVATSTQIELDISLVIDRSGSMAYADTEVADGSANPIAAPAGWMFGDEAPPNSRWLDLVSATTVFLDELDLTPQSEKVALASYNQDSSSDVTLTDSFGSIMDALNVHTQIFNGGATNIGSGIEAGLNNLSGAERRPWASAVLVLMTDGNHNTGLDPLVAAQSAASNGVTIYTITFSAEANQGTMQQVAEETGGIHYHAGTSEALIDAFREIAKSLPTLLTH